MIVFVEFESEDGSDIRVDRTQVFALEAVANDATRIYGPGSIGLVVKGTPAEVARKLER